ncbi:hypothetical protein [Streptomyces sp. NPDC048436]|uniref:hypothetical protein n=1 Tax=Streptomyces sp. NPDC048436 TaxID=3365550 RepID=UPI0037196165
MDQEIAAIVTGAFGLVGVAIGGAAAAWGARTGAERTARATHQQVRDQADAEHAHWLRQQRLEAYEGFMRGYDGFARVASESLRAAEERRSRSDQSGREAHLSESLPSASEVDAMGAQVRAMEEHAARISVVGPSSMDECAAQLARAAGLEHQRYAGLRERPSNEPHQQDMALDEIQAQTEHRKRFLAAARLTLGAPPNLGTRNQAHG